MHLGAVDWTILILYIIINIALGVYLSRKIKSLNDFLIGGRTFTWFSVGISVLATYVSAQSFLGGPVWSYNSGFSVLAIHMNYAIVAALVITYLLPFFYNSGSISIHEYFQRRFGETSRLINVAMFYVIQGLSSGAVLYGSGVIISFITGYSISFTIVFVALLAICYTVLGGLSAVIWTDVLQAGIFTVGVLAIFYYLAQGFEPSGGLSEALSAVKADGATPNGVAGLQALDTQFEWFGRETSVWAGLIGMVVYHYSINGTNQMIIQRLLATKDLSHAKRAMAFMGYAAFIFYFLFVLAGVLLRQFYGGVKLEELLNGADPNTLVLKFTQDYGATGILGLICAAALAAAMSSIDSAINSFATSTLEDLYRPLRPNETDHHYLAVSRASTVIWGLVLIIPALLAAAAAADSILLIISKFGSYLVGAQIGYYLVGIHSTKVNEKGAIIGLVTGGITVWYLATWTSVAWPWYGVFGGLGTYIPAVFFSRFFPPITAEQAQYTLKGQKLLFERERRPEKENGVYLIPGKWDRMSYRLLAYTAATVLFVIIFRALF